MIEIHRPWEWSWLVGTSAFYLFGGYVYDGVGVSNDLWMFDAAASVWTQLSANNASEASPQPPPRQAATMVGVDDGAEEPLLCL